MPLAFAALLTGVVLSVGSEWGLLRHYWIATKLGITVVGTAILLRHMATVSDAAATARVERASLDAFTQQTAQLVMHAAGGLIVLLVATVLSIYRPWGLTAYGKRRSKMRSSAPLVTAPRALQPVGHSPRIASGAWWAKVIGAHVVVVSIVLLAVLHLTGAMPRH